MKTFHHGGRIGDLIFALWTMKHLGGGRLIISDYQKGNWDLDIAESMRSFLELQPYIEEVRLIRYEAIQTLCPIDYDLHAAEDGIDVRFFPEYDREKYGWPGNINIIKLYCTHFGLNDVYTKWLETREPWLVAPVTKQRVDVALHCPLRRSVRSRGDWMHILNDLWDEELLVAVLGREEIMICMSRDLLESASWINSAKVFLGTVSSCNAVAEGLGKTRFVEQAPDCFNVNVDPPSVSINGMTNEEVVRRVLEVCK
jgi:hypothetical protein